MFRESCGINAVLVLGGEILPRLCTSLGERAFCFSGPHCWNNLPYELRSMTNVNSFRRQQMFHF